jgi:hypothetical protein
MRLIVLTVMGLIGGLGLAAAIVSVPVMAEKGPLRDTLVADLGGAQEELPGGGDPDGRGRAVVKVFEEQLCGRVKTSAIESSSSTKATINLGMSGEKGPTVANLQEERAATPTTGTTTGTTAGTTGTTTGTTGGTTGTTTGTTGTITVTTTGTTGTTTPTTDTTTATTGTTTGAQTGTTTTTTTGDTTLAQATTEQSTTLAQTSPSQSTASPTASASASASAASPSADTILEHTGGCVAVPRALSLELLEHPRRYYVNVTNEQYPEGAIKGQLQRSADHRSGEHRSGDGDDD